MNIRDLSFWGERSLKVGSIAWVCGQLFLHDRHGGHRHFCGVLHGSQGLVLQGGRATVPELFGAENTVDDGGRLPTALLATHPDRELPWVGEPFLWNVARRTGNTAVNR